jgi:hypothetical protein
MKHKLVRDFQAEEMWPDHNPNDLIGFDNFFDCIAKWSIRQEKLDYEDFASEEEKTANASSDFKKITERIM